MVAHVDDVHTGTRMLHRLLRHRQAEQARANDDEIGILGGFRIIRCISHSKQTFHKSCSFSESPYYLNALPLRSMHIYPIKLNNIIA